MRDTSTLRESFTSPPNINGSNRDISVYSSSVPANAFGTDFGQMYAGNSTRKMAFYTTLVHAIENERALEEQRMAQRRKDLQRAQQLRMEAMQNRDAQHRAVEALFVQQELAAEEQRKITQEIIRQQRRRAMEERIENEHAAELQRIADEIAAEEAHRADMDRVHEQRLDSLRSFKVNVTHGVVEADESLPNASQIGVLQMEEQYRGE